MNKNKSFFITIEGGEGSGKTSNSLLLKKYLESKGFKVLLTREPGGTVAAESIRKILLNPKSKLTPLSELFLYEAARAQHIEEIVRPALKSGAVVICDRFTDATVAYQGFARKLDLSLINKLNAAASGKLIPELTIYLDINPKTGLKKAKNLDKESYGVSGDRIEMESFEFHKNVRKGYLAQAKKYPKRIKVVKTDKDINKTWSAIKKEIDAKLKIKNV
ncbi:dTMP kinase [Endomicrobium proavitum]|uniref:Thymidylate kinase n=1 Tax=Endomicrobium proavitum TaxID=1408281 RepID=A0A0G3WHV3_9BACT|nr:dTMP kinase [Endomicrobium proavitum]AKL97445.1 Thymidylate kinase [Endomicrobium proavitum]